MSRIIKIVEISVSKPASYKYPRKRWCIVECDPDQHGYKTEKGVRVLWESSEYSPCSGFPPHSYKQMFYEQAQIRADHFAKCLKAGLVYLTYPEIVEDRLKELGLLSM